jgi:hypothetical protein
MRRMLRDGEIVREEKAPVVGRLTLHGPDEPELAVEDTHFIAVPEPFDEFMQKWTELAHAR